MAGCAAFSLHPWLTSGVQLGREARIVRSCRRCRRGLEVDVAGEVVAEEGEGGGLCGGFEACEAAGLGGAARWARGEGAVSRVGECGADARGDGGWAVAEESGQSAAMGCGPRRPGCVGARVILRRGWIAPTHPAEPE